MPDNFQTLMAKGAIAQSRISQPGQSSAIVRGQVTGNEDETGLQRHTITTGGKGGQVDCPPGSRLLPCPHWSPPQFTKGMTALAGAIEGDGHNLSVLGVELNKANAAPAKGDAVKDDSRMIPGDKILLVIGKETRQVNKGVKILAGSTVVEIAPDGRVSVKAGRVELSGDLKVSGDLEVAGGATVKGKEVAVAGGAFGGGAMDTGGDRVVVSGQ